MPKRIIAIVGAANPPGHGLVRAIASDKEALFAARAITLDANTDTARALASMGAEMVVGHAGAGAGLKTAFAGAYGAFCFRPAAGGAATQKELTETIGIAQAAKDAGLQHVIWATIGETRNETARVFASLGVPITFLRAFGDPGKVLGDGVAEEIGRSAYGVFRSGQYIGQTVSVSADLLAWEKKHGAREMGTSSTAGVGAGTSSRGLRRARVIVPAFLVLGLVVFGILRSVHRESNGLPTSDTARASEPASATPPPASAAGAGDPDKAGGKPAETIVAQKQDDDKKTEATTGSDPPAGGKAEPTRAAAQPYAEPPPKQTPVVAVLEPIKRPPIDRTPRPRRRGHGERGESGAAEPAEKPEPPARESPPPPEEPKPAAKPAPKAAAPAPTPPPAAPAAPPAPARAAATTAPAAATASLKPGTVDQRAVSAAVRKHAAEVRACYDRATMEKADLRGRLNVQATIDSSGRVLSVNPSSTIDGGGRLQACIVSAFQGWTFPAPAGGVNGSISYSFSFE